jgi:hypothetical protein
MIQALLLLNCDYCRQPFNKSLITSTDRAAFNLTSSTLGLMAHTEKWDVTTSNDSHICPVCTYRTMAEAAA